MAREHGPAILPLAILEVLRQHSDADHPLQQKAIGELLTSEFGLAPHRKTLSMNLDNLIAANYPIEYSESERTQPSGEVQVLRSDFYYNHLFDESELRLLIDSVFASKHIPSNLTSALITRLQSLSSKYFLPHIDHVATLPKRKSQNDQYFYTISILDEAIERGCSIHCHYMTYDHDLNRVPRVDASGKIRDYHLDPYQLAAVNGYYYLICSKRPYESISHYRVDRIMNIRIDEEVPLRPLTELSEVEGPLSLPEHVAEHLYMFNGRSSEVTFLANPRIVSDLMDWFSLGAQIRTTPDGRLRVKVQVNEEAMHYWSLQYGPNVEVLEPKRLRKRIKDSLKQMQAIYEED